MKTRYKTLIAGTAIAVMLGVVWHSCTKEVSTPIKSALKLNDSPSATERMVRDDAPSGNQFNVDFPNEASTATDGLTTAYSVCQKAFKDLDAWDGEMCGQRLGVEYTDRNTGYKIEASTTMLDYLETNDTECEMIKLVVSKDDKTILELYRSNMSDYTAAVYTDQFGDKTCVFIMRPGAYSGDKPTPSMIMANVGSGEIKIEDCWVVSESHSEETATRKNINGMIKMFKTASLYLRESPHVSTTEESTSGGSIVPADYRKVISALKTKLSGPEFGS